jgi:hypothetical protein
MAKKPKFGSPEWMAYIRSMRGKKGHTHKAKAKGKHTNKYINSHRLKHPIVEVDIPRGAILKVKRKPTNPYYIRAVDDRSGQTVSEKIWYSPDYKEHPSGFSD